MVLWPINDVVRPPASAGCQCRFSCTVGVEVSLSGENAGQIITLMPCCFMKSYIVRAVCAHALSCWNSSSSLCFTASPDQNRLKSSIMYPVNLRIEKHADVCGGVN